ncbi:MAG: hypothetical protein ACXQTI_08265 [Candidatus Nezhaarchaeales archaeon]
MVHTVMTEVMLTVAIATIAAFLAASFYSSMSSFYDVYRMAIGVEKEKALTNIEIIFATNVSSSEAKIWVKNIGQKPITRSLIAKASLIFGPTAECQLLGYNTTVAPYWTFSLASDFDHDGAWDPSETIEIDVIWDTTLAPGDYYVKLILYNGVSDDYYFSI